MNFIFSTRLVSFRVTLALLVPFLSVTPDLTTTPMASSHQFTPLAKFQLVWRRLCEALLYSSSLAGQKNPSLLFRLCLTYVGDIKVLLP